MGLIFAVAGDNDEVAAVHTTEHDAGPFLEKIAVDLVAAQERDAAIPIGALGAHDLEFVGEILRLRFVFLSRLETASAAMGVVDEVPGHGGGHAVERQRNEESAEAPAYDHA